MHQLQKAGTGLPSILYGGAFSIRTTHKSHSQTAEYLSLEQSYNRDAASATKELQHSEILKTMRCWAVARSQTTTMEQLKNASAQFHDYRVRKYNEHMQVISSTIEDSGDPFFSYLELLPLINLAPGKFALLNTKNYSLLT